MRMLTALRAHRGGHGEHSSDLKRNLSGSFRHNDYAIISSMARQRHKPDVTQLFHR